MIELVKELKKTMKERLVGTEEAARIIGCTSRNLYRWIHGEITPTVKMQNQIRQAIGKMRRLFPTETEQKKGEAHLETLKTFLEPEYRFENEENTVVILGRMSPEDLHELLYASGMHKERALLLCKKKRIKLVKT